MVQDDEEFEQDSLQKRSEGLQRIQLMGEESVARIEASKAEARARPKPQPSNGSAK
jgi:hypothetical protein